jgi:hypothetical protein
MGQPPAFGHRKDLNADKTRDERGCTQMLPDHVPIRGITTQIRIAPVFNGLILDRLLSPPKARLGDDASWAVM